MTKLTIFALLAVGFCQAFSAAKYSVYHIGNSLTRDATPETLWQLFELNTGLEVDGGQHITCGKSLNYISRNPFEVCRPPNEPFGTWSEALAGFEWDVVTIQAYPGATALEEVLATIHIIASATNGGRNEDCIFYLYFAWPGIGGAEFSEIVRGSLVDVSAPCVLNSGFLDYWYSSVSAVFPQYDVRVIPTGIAMSVIDEKLRELPIQSYGAMSDLYRDDIHMGWQDGRHVAMACMLSCLLETSTDGIKYSPDYWTTRPLVLKRMTDVAIWYTITADSRTKVSAGPDIEIRASGELLELDFVGRLQSTQSLWIWDEIVDATAPYRVYPESETQQRFFRALPPDP